MSEFKCGFGYLLSGFTLIIKPKIRFYSLTPLFLNISLFLVLIFYSYSELEKAISTLELQWQWLEWLGWIVWVFFFIGISVLIFFCFSILGNLISAPFNSILAKVVEEEITGIKINSNSGESVLNLIINSFKSEYCKLLYFALRIPILILLFFIPPISVLAPLIWFIFSSWMLAIEYCDFPMGNHNIVFSKQRESLSSKKLLIYGFGVGVLLFTIIPIVNFIIIPVAVAGATKMYVESIKLEY